MLFGVCSILLNVFRMGYDIIHLQCKTQLEILFPCIEILFICIQVLDSSLVPARPLIYTVERKVIYICY